MTTLQRVYYRDEVRSLLGGITSEALRKLINLGKVPKPDVDITNRTQGWNTSTLLALGFKLPDADAAQVPALEATAPNPSSSAT